MGKRVDFGGKEIVTARDVYEFDITQSGNEVLKREYLGS